MRIIIVRGNNMKKELENRIVMAKSDSARLDQLLKDYLPFIKKQMRNVTDADWLTVAMLAFVNSVKQYEPERGNFLSFASLCIRSRIIDELRKESGYSSKVVPLYKEDENDNIISPADFEVSMKNYNKELERQMLADEIDALSIELKAFGISFAQLPKICPKQERSRKLCLRLAKEVIKDQMLKTTFFNTHRIPQATLADRFEVSVKTIEKHRKFIVTIVILLNGGYPGIRTFLPQYKEVEE